MVREVRPGLSALGSPRLHRFCLSALSDWQPQLLRPRFESCYGAGFSSLSSSVLWFFGPSLHGRYSASPLLRPLLTSPSFSRKRSPQVRCTICPLAPPGSTVCVLMTFGLRCSQPACRPHPASLPVRVPTVEALLPASFSFTSRLRLAVRYGYRHRFRLAPFIQLDSAHAGHTGAGNLARSRLFRRLSIVRELSQFGTSQSCSSAVSMNRLAIAIPSSSSIVKRAKFSSPSPVHHERS